MPNFFSLKGRSTVVMPFISLCSSSNPASIISLCIFLSPGLPSGLPGENLRDNILGGFVSSISSLLNVTHTVLMPDSSSPLATSPTDWLQMTHVGVRKAISTPSPLSRFPTVREFSRSGPVS